MGLWSVAVCACAVLCIEPYPALLPLLLEFALGFLSSHLACYASRGTILSSAGGRVGADWASTAKKFQMSPDIYMRACG